MIRKLTALSFVALSACAMPIAVPAPSVAPAPAPAPMVNPQSAKERFVAAAEANGCVVNQQTAGAILAVATLSQEDLARVMTELKAEGRGEIAPDGQSFIVTTGGCA
jgi:hypothetical protein